LLNTPIAALHHRFDYQWMRADGTKITGGNCIGQDPG